MGWLKRLVCALHDHGGVRVYGPFEGSVYLFRCKNCGAVWHEGEAKP